MAQFIIPERSGTGQMRYQMGYALAEALQDSILAEKGTRLRGHLFHWSKLRGPKGEAAYRILEPEVQREGFVLGPQSNILGSYLHLHFGSDVSLAQRFVASCARWAK